MGRPGRPGNRSRRRVEAARVWRRAEYRWSARDGCRKLHLRRREHGRSPTTSGVHRRVRSVQFRVTATFCLLLLLFFSDMPLARSLANFASFFVSVWRIQYHSVVVGAAAAAAAGASSTWRLHQIISSTCPSLTSSAQHTCWQRRMSHLFPRKRSLPLVKVFSSDPWNVNDSSVSNKKVC